MIALPEFSAHEVEFLALSEIPLTRSRERCSRRPSDREQGSGSLASEPRTPSCEFLRSACSSSPLQHSAQRNRLLEPFQASPQKVRGRPSGFLGRPLETIRSLALTVVSRRR